MDRENYRRPADDYDSYGQAPSQRPAYSHTEEGGYGESAGRGSSSEPQQNGYQDYRGTRRTSRPEEGPARPPRKKRKRRGCLVAFLLALVLLFSSFGFLFVYVGNEINGKHATAVGTVIVEIPLNSGTEAIGNALQAKGLIGSALIFRAYVRFRQESPAFQAATFTLTGGMTYEEIIAVLTTPVDERETVMVTFPETRSAIRFAIICEDAGLCTREGFLAAANNIEAYADIPAISRLVDDFDPNTFMKAEGYLAPNTYQFYVDETPEEIVRKLYWQFDAVVTPFYEQMERQGLSLREAITLASIVEAEASGTTDENRRLVAGVFWNRLQNPEVFPHLGSEVTFWYLRDVVATYYDNDWRNIPPELFNAYHTEEHNPQARVGLPAGPIGAPSVLALEAALNPDTADGYYFFVTDLTGKYYFARTLEEHEANIREMERINNSLSGQAA